MKKGGLRGHRGAHKKEAAISSFQRRGGVAPGRVLVGNEKKVGKSKEKKKKTCSRVLLCEAHPGQQKERQPEKAIKRRKKPKALGSRAAPPGGGAALCTVAPCGGIPPPKKTKQNKTGGPPEEQQVSKIRTPRLDGTSLRQRGGGACGCVGVGGVWEKGGTSVWGGRSDLVNDGGGGGEQRSRGGGFKCVANKKVSWEASFKGRGGEGGEQPKRVCVGRVGGS